MQGHTKRITARIGTGTLYLKDVLNVLLHSIKGFNMTDHASTNAMFDVLEEMNRQDEKWGADRNQHPFVWQAILGEEVGEVCQAMLHDEFGGSHAGTAREELVQVTAVALQIIEQYDRLSSVSEDSE